MKLEITLPINSWKLTLTIFQAFVKSVLSGAKDIRAWGVQAALTASFTWDLNANTDKRI